MAAKVTGCKSLLQYRVCAPAHVCTRNRINLVPFRIVPICMFNAAFVASGPGCH